MSCIDKVQLSVSGEIDPKSRNQDEGSQNDIREIKKSCDTIKSPRTSQSSSPEGKIETDVKGMPHKEEDGEYDSDAMVIVESDDDVRIIDDHVTSTSHSPVFVPKPEDVRGMKQMDGADDNQTKLHGLPIHELKLKLSHCSVCDIQYHNHKQANLCLSKHGKRQCWLCLEVMANSKDSYFQHCVRYHAIGQSNDIVGCPYCEKFFDFRQGINQHIVKVHFSEDISYVQTTACLSPKSLVDIYTGKPRAKEDGEDVPNSANEVSTTTSPHGESQTDPIVLTEHQNVSDGDISISDLIIIPHTALPCNLNHIPNSPNLPSLEKESAAGDINMNIDRVAMGAKRESVIRETPNIAIPLSAVIHGPSHPALMNYEEGKGTQEINSSPQGNNELHEQTIHFNPLSHSYAVQARSSPSRSSHPNENMRKPVGRPVSRTPQHQSVPIDYDEFMGQRRLINFHGVNSWKHLNVALAERQKSRNSAHYPHHATNAPNMREDIGVTKQIIPSPSAYNEQQQKSVQAHAFSPCLMEIEKLVHGTGNASGTVPNHYFDSVDNMLRTVAQCRPGLAFPSPDYSSPELTTQSTSTHNSSHQFLRDDLRDSQFSVPPVSPVTGESLFKVPCGGGIKRRILKKWGEQDKRNERTIVPSPVLSSMELSQLKDDQVEIHTNLNPGNNGFGIQRQYGHTFWETVLKESGSMFPGTPGNDPASQFGCRIYDSYGDIPVANSFPNWDYCQQSYSRAMSVNQMNGRQLVPSQLEMMHPYGNLNPHNLLTATGGVVGNHGESHSRYQHTIVRHCQSEEPVYLQTQAHNPNPRRRKSSTPHRKSNTTNSYCDSIVVQNPFEEGEISPPSNKKMNRVPNNPTSYPNPHPPTSKVEDLHDLIFGLGKRPLPRSGRFIHAQPKFTSGGQIMDFSIGMGAEQHSQVFSPANKGSPKPETNVQNLLTSQSVQAQPIQNYYGQQEDSQIRGVNKKMLGIGHHYVEKQ